MKITYSTYKNRGTLDNVPLAEKPSFSFDYEYIYIEDEIAEYTPKERANYPELKDIPEDIMISEYVNRPLSDDQLVEVTKFYSSYPREPEVKPMFNEATEKLVENGTEVIYGLTYKKYEVIALTQTELEARYRASIPQSIDPRQIRKQLTNMGLRQTAESIISESDDYDLKDWWEYSLEYQRNHPVLALFASQMNLTDAQLDDMFIEAAEL